ncbi:hypothetical protein [Nocardia farcinica]|uniref:hypothetical protein n=1 Tax=Nocardia farcinica TaxID=37329 RepID=UPI001895B59B|nr:hypothetical protein [Nocardia farcinica]MBF6072170.1 hypothetical protein [Nocardia farcinica]
MTERYLGRHEQSGGQVLTSRSRIYAAVVNLVITSAREQTFRATLDSADILDTLLDGAEDADDHHHFMGDVLRPFLLNAI